MEEMTTGHAEFLLKEKQIRRDEGVSVFLITNRMRYTREHGSVKHNRRLVTQNHNKNIKKHNHKTLQHRQKNETDSFVHRGERSGRGLSGYKDGGGEEIIQNTNMLFI